MKSSQGHLLRWRTPQINTMARVKRFEVLDSTRTLKDKAFLATANKIMKGIKANWDRHCNNSSVQIKNWELQEIKCPKQDNRNKVLDSRQDAIQASAAISVSI